MTVLKWKHRTDFEDRPHTAHRLQTTLTPAQQAIVVELRKTLLLSLDDLLAVTRKFINPDVGAGSLPEPPWREQPQSTAAANAQACAQPVCGV
ncbi:hypothetical protein JCM13664_22210 [Methylothermus subterraneus]